MGIGTTNARIQCHVLVFTIRLTIPRNGNNGAINPHRKGSLNMRKTSTSLLLSLWLLTFVQGYSTGAADAQTPLKRVRLGIPATSLAFLPLWVAYHKGFYRDEGIDLDLVLMSRTVANPAVLTGEIDYHGGVGDLVVAIVNGAPAKALIFTGDRTQHVIISRTEIEQPAQLKGKRIAGGPAGGMASQLVERVLRNFGLDPRQDVSILALGLSDSERLAALQAGVVDAIIIGVPENIRATKLGHRELVFVGDLIQFPFNGFGSSDKKIRENPDEVLRMVRATLRALVFLSEKKMKRKFGTSLQSSGK